MVGVALQVCLLPSLSCQLSDQEAYLLIHQVSVVAHVCRGAHGVTLLSQKKIRYVTLGGSSSNNRPRCDCSAQTLCACKHLCATDCL
jgi:hypothetical protein